MGRNEVLTIKDVATFLRIADKTAYLMAQRGELPGFKVGGQWRFTRSDIDAWMEERKRTSGTGGSSEPRKP